MAAGEGSTLKEDQIVRLGLNTEDSSKVIYMPVELCCEENHRFLCQKLREHGGFKAANLAQFSFTFGVHVLVFSKKKRCWTGLLLSLFGQALEGFSFAEGKEMDGKHNVSFLNYFGADTSFDPWRFGPGRLRS